jgi:8-oxo-dGTP pyrophosphatase MutT (NUDIX family)
VNGGAEVVWAGPVELAISHAPTELPAELEARVQELWDAEREQRPVVNGSIACVESMQDGRIEGRLAEYRLFIARERSAELRDRLQLQPIGVSGVVVFPNGDVLLGRRSEEVTEYPGAWELVPSGAVGGDAVGADGRVDTLAVLLTELEEETGIRREAVVAARPLGVVHDPGQDGFDICYELRLSGEAELPASDSSEYGELRVLSAEEAELLMRAGAVVPASRTILALRKAR